ncbi:MAG: hypothetical protein ABI618_17760 [Nitrospirota bacterium]
MDATITMLSVMFMLWAAAVWASFKEDPDEKRPLSVEDGSLAEKRYKKGA